MTQRVDRPQILLLPGNMCDARLWRGGGGAIVRAIEAQGYLVHDVDFGCDETIDAMAARALSICDGTLVPIGFSMGGIVALDMCRQAPARIVALGLIDTTCHPDTRGQERLRQQQDVRDGRLAQVVTQELKPNYLAHCHADDAKLLDLLCDMALQLGPDIFVAQSEALRTRADLTPMLGQLNMPVFIACGAQDSLCPPALHRDIAAAIPQAQLHIVNDAGHILPLEQPIILADLLSQFLTSTLGNQT